MASKMSGGQLKQTLLLLLVLTIHLLCPPILAASFKYCDGKGVYPMKVVGVEVSPDPVVAGKPATFNISASLGKDVAGGKVLVDVSYFSIHVHTETHDLCEDMSCPVSAGSFVLSNTQSLPGFAPPGSYSLKMTMEDGNGGLLTCFSFNFRIGFGASFSHYLFPY